jgi:hypothetical protein
MPKRSEVPALSGAKGSFPMPSYYGLTGGVWSKIEKFALENHDLRERSNAVSQRRYELQQELEYQRTQLDEQRAIAARNDDAEPDDGYVKLTEREIRKCDDKARALARAADIAFGEFTSVMAQARHYPDSREYAALRDGLQKMREMADKAEQEYRRLIAEAEKARDELGAAYAMHLWLREDYDPRSGRVGIPFQMFGGVPPSGFDSKPWYTRPLDWGDEAKDPTISTQSAPGLVG